MVDWVTAAAKKTFLCPIFAAAYWKGSESNVVFNNLTEFLVTWEIRTAQVDPYQKTKTSKPTITTSFIDHIYIVDL